MRSGQCRAQRRLHHFRDLLKRELAEVPEQNHLPLSLGQSRDRLFNAASSLPSLQVDRDARINGFLTSYRCRGRFRLATALPHAVTGEIPRDLENPCVEAALFAIHSDRPNHAKKDLLNHVIRITVGKDPPQEAGDPRRVLVYQQVEGVRFEPSCPNHYFFPVGLKLQSHPGFRLIGSLSTTLPLADYCRKMKPVGHKLINFSSFSVLGLPDTLAPARWSGNVGVRKHKEWLPVVIRPWPVPGPIGRDLDCLH